MDKVLPPENREVGKAVLPPMVTKRQAVSPTARPMESMMPVTMPGSAAGSSTRHTVCHLVAPRASAASRCDRGNRPEGLLGGPDQRRQEQAGQCQGSGQDREAEVQRGHEEGKPKKPEDYGWNAGQNLRPVSDQARHPVVGSVLGQVDGRTHSQRHRDGHGETDQVQGAHNHGGDASLPRCATPGRRGQEGPVHVSYAFDQDIGDDHQQDEHRHDPRPPDAGQGQLLGEPGRYPRHVPPS